MADFANPTRISEFALGLSQPDYMTSWSAYVSEPTFTHLREPLGPVGKRRLRDVGGPARHVVGLAEPERELGDPRRVGEVRHDSDLVVDLGAAPLHERFQRGRLRPVRQPHGVHGDHAELAQAPAREEAAEVKADRLCVVQVLVEEGQPHALLLDRAHGEDADVAARELEDRMARGRDVRAVGDERAHVLHRELVRQIVAPPADDVERVGRVHPPRVDAVDLGDNLEAPSLIDRLGRTRVPVVAPAVSDEVPGRRRLRLLGVAGEALVHPVVLRTRRRIETVRDPLGNDQEVALGVGNRSEGRLQGAAPLVDEEDHRGRVVLEEVFHRRTRGRHIHRRRRVRDQLCHPAVGVGRVFGRHHPQREVGAPDRAQRRLPVGGEPVQHPRLVREPVRRRVQMIGVAHRPREAAPAVLLLVDVAEEGTGVGCPGNDPDLRNPAEVLELFHSALPPADWPDCISIPSEFSLAPNPIRGDACPLRLGRVRHG